MRIFLVMFLLATPLPALADAASDAHIQSAFLFAKRRNWNEAVAHAQAAHSPILAKYFTWESLKDPQSDAPFSAIVEFLNKNPRWPDRSILEKRAEVALLADNPSQEELDDWFTKHPPRTSMAKFKAARDKEALQGLVREAWVNDDYDQVTEAKLLAKYGAMLRPEDHIHRLDRLLWEGKEDEARRLMKWAPYDYQRLFQARLALMQDKSRALVDMVNLPPALKADPGLLYERLRWRLRRGDKDGVRQLLLAAPAVVPYPEKWWPIRDRQIREALGEGKLPLALALLANHGQKDDSISLKEAQWLSGWIALRFEKQPEKAYRTFTTLYKTTETPSGKARVAYWLARAAEETHSGKAGYWFGEAARYPTTFYGELAMQEANRQAKISVHSDGEPSHAEKERFEKHELVQLVFALHRARQSDLAERFILYLVENADSLDEAILATRLGREINRIDFGVRASKKALQNGIMSLESGYPVIRVPESAVPDKALLLALARQESEFFADAVSTANAYGLMQILPRTAHEIARKSHLPYGPNRLFDPDYNMEIGSIYLGKLLDKFNGSYVLAVASYNAGPARVEQWEGQFGLPGNTPREAVDWIETIPFTETRHYVQHVLENTEVYRFMLAGKTPVKLEIEKDLTR